MLGYLLYSPLKGRGFINQGLHEERRFRPPKQGAVRSEEESNRHEPLIIQTAGKAHGMVLMVPLGRKRFNRSSAFQTTIKKSFEIREGRLFL